MARNSYDVCYLFTYSINNYNLWLQKGFRHLLDSCQVAVEFLNNYHWNLRLCNATCNYLVLNLSREENIEILNKFDTQISIDKENGSRICFENVGPFFEQNDSLLHPFPATIKPAVEERVSLEDSLIIQCRVYNKTTKDLFKCLEIPMEIQHTFLPICYKSDTIFVSEKPVVLKSVTTNYPEMKINLTKQHEVVDLIIHVPKWRFSLFVRCEIEIRKLKDSGRTLFRCCRKFEVETWIETWKLSNLFHSVMSDLKYSGDKWYTMEVNLFISDASDHSFIESIIFSYTMHKSRQANISYAVPLFKRIEKIFLEEKVPDFTIKCGSRVFKIHKSIFGSVSPVFSSMFESNVRQKNDSTIQIKDLDSDTLEKLIHFVYTAQVKETDWSDALQLFAAANRYQIMELKKPCVEILKSKLNVENVLEILMFADIYQDQMLKNVTKQLIIKNAVEVFCCKKGRTFKRKHPRIFSEVMHELFPSERLLE